MAEMFQKRVLAKYIKNHIQQNEKLLDECYAEFCKTFCNKEKQANILISKEEQYQEGFLRELFVASLGYTINPDVGFNLITEEKNIQNSKKADGAVKVAEKVVAVIELKDHKTQTLDQIEAQAFGYKSSHDCKYVITSNFEKLRFYINTTSQYTEFRLFDLSKEEFIKLHLLLSFENIKADVPATIKGESIVEEENITDKLYQKYSAFKKALFADLIKNNPEKDTLQLFKKSQKLLDRLLFIFFAEDRGLLPVNTIATHIKDWKEKHDPYNPSPLYNRFKLYFSFLDTGHADLKIFAYNGGLFQTDEFLDSLIISDSVLEKHITELSAYDFETDVSVNILGHIFEHSLTEIEKITNAISEGVDPLTLHEPKKTKGSKANKKDGVFYTPPYITQYIVENTVGALCTQKKAELEINEQEYFEYKTPSKKAKKEKEKQQVFSDKIRSYREWLKKITICDPACGSGAFLVAALDFLMKEHKKLDEMNASLFGDMIVFEEVEMSILENNLFGVDINEESVEICKLSLWLHTAKPKRKLNTLSNNIKCGNSLISDKTFVENAFNWQEEFPHIFAEGGFDVVIGNPPYVPAELISNSDKNYYEKTFKSAFGRINLYPLFYELAINLLKQNAFLGFITPYTILKNKYYIEARKYILTNTDIKTLIDFKGTAVFKNATVDSIIFILTKTNQRDNVFNYITNIIDFELLSYESNLVEKDLILKKEDFSFEDLNSTIDLKRIKEICIPVSKIVNFKQGIITGNNKKYVSKLKDILSKKVITGADFNRYTMEWPGNFILYDEKLLHRARTPQIFEQAEKLMLRQTGAYPICTLDTEQYYTLDTIHNGIIIDTNYNIKYILVILNSKAFRFFYETTINETGKVFAQVKIIYIDPLPIPNISPAEQAPFIELADKMIQLNKDFAKSKDGFLKTVSENLQPKTLSIKLQKFYEINFSDFKIELKKQGSKIPLKEDSDWRELFEKTTSLCLTYLEHISATDTIIDEKVYELYGLTEEEIAVVEGQR